MIFYEFMNPDYLKDKNRIKNHMIEKYGIDLSENLRDNRAKVLEDYLVDRIKSSNYKERMKLDSIAPTMEKDSINQIIVSRMLEQLYTLIEKTESYYADLNAEIYMGLLFNDPQNRRFPYKRNIKRADFYTEVEYQEATQLGNDFMNKIDRMSSTWKRKSNSNKVNKSSVWANYPVPIYRNRGGEDFIISGIPGGCFCYHEEMTKSSNNAIFDTETKITTLKRYAFPRAYKIYSELKERPIENLLMMEYTLGMGYTNQIYEHLRESKKRDELGFYEELIVVGAKFLHIFWREKITSIIWSEIWEDCDELLMVYVKKILTEVLKIIEEIMVDVLELWWYSFFYYPYNGEFEKTCIFSDQDRLEILIYQYWHKHYELYIHKAYNDHVVLLGIHDWFGIKNVEDCFKKSMSWPLYYHNFRMKDIYGTIKEMYVEPSINKIGTDILEKIEKRSVKDRLPEDLERIYTLFYGMRESEFYNLKKKEDYEFYNNDPRLTKPTQTVKCNLIYAILHQTIINTQLKEIRRTADIRRTPKQVYENSETFDNKK